MLGAEVRFVHGDDAAEMDRVLRATADEVRAHGRRPYVMNHAGAFALGSALAYLLCTLESVEQLAALGLEATDLYMASGNKGHAGLIAGQKLLGTRFRTVAISQRYGDDRIPGALSGVRDALATLGWDLLHDLTPQDVGSYDEYVGASYGTPIAQSLAALQLAARAEGLLLDPIYTGKAMAGLIDQVRRGMVSKDSTVVFIHTGGLPAIFAFKNEIINWLETTVNT